MEREAAKARRGKAGWETIEGAGLIAAGFRHRTSRLGDPQLHTHVLVANATLGEDGQWGSLHGKHIYHHARAAGHLYQVELRHGLTMALGVSWMPTVKGMAEIVGVPADVLAEFSKRHAQILAEQERTGDHSAAGGRRAAEATRPAKVEDVDYQELRAEWTARSTALGFSVEDARRLVGPRRDPQRGVVEVDDATIAVAVVANRSTYDRRQAVIAVANLVPASWAASHVEARADEFLAGREAVPVGVSMYGVMYSTVELVEIAQRLLAGAEARVGGSTTVCERAGEALDAAGSLSDEQRTMVEAITTSGDGVSVVVGAANTGKTHAFGVAREVWERHGYTVIGAALAARAAANLQGDSGIPSCSLDRLLGQLDRGRLRLWCDTVVVLGEAAMVGTAKLQRLLDHALRAMAKVVLVGDHHQLPEIEAGGAFAALAERLGAVTLSENRRQSDPVERDALAELRTGDVDEALSLLAATGHVHEHNDRTAARVAIVEAWLDDILDEGADSIMLAPSRTAVADLNEIARARLREFGAVEERDVHFGERSFAEGDWVMTTQNDYVLGVLNGRRGVITNIAADGNSLVATIGDNEHPVLLSRSQIEARLLDHAYAITIHKAQGLTCDTTHVLADENLYREAAYTALSRGRDANHLYVTPGAGVDDSHVPDDNDEDGLDALTRALANSRQQRLASIDLRDLPSTSGGVAIGAEPIVDTGADWGIEI